MNDDRGVISVEALIAVTVFIVLMSFLLSLTKLFYIEDVMSQTVLEEVGELEKYNYLYEKVGVFDTELLNHLEIPLEASRLEFLDQFMGENLNHLTKELFLKSIYKRQLETIEQQLSSISNVILKRFTFSENRLEAVINYNHNLPFNMMIAQTISIKKTFWLFGNDGKLYEHQTLADFVNQTDDTAGLTIVYTTKSGTKYHKKTCFYIIRSTTDHQAVRKINMKKALSELLKPCKRCILNEGGIWN